MSAWRRVKQIEKFFRNRRSRDFAAMKDFVLAKGFVFAQD
jgi:hypothetical protein